MFRTCETLVQSAQKKPREALLSKPDTCTESELEIVSLCSPKRSRRAPDLPYDQLLTSWCSLLREGMLAHYKFVTAKGHLENGTKTCSLLQQLICYYNV